MLLTAGQESDIGPAEARLADHEPEVVVADQGYDKKEVAAGVAARGAAAVIPARKNRKEQRAVDPHVYRERNVVERFWARAEPFRRVATRYEKKAANSLAFAWVAALVVMMA